MILIANIVMLENVCFAPGAKGDVKCN